MSNIRSDSGSQISSVNEDHPSIKQIEKEKPQILKKKGKKSGKSSKRASKSNKREG